MACSGRVTGNVALGLQGFSEIGKEDDVSGADIVPVAANIIDSSKREVQVGVLEPYPHLMQGIGYAGGFARTIVRLEHERPCYLAYHPPNLLIYPVSWSHRRKVAQHRQGGCSSQLSVSSFPFSALTQKPRVAPPELLEVSKSVKTRRRTRTIRLAVAGTLNQGTSPRGDFPRRLAVVGLLRRCGGLSPTHRYSRDYDHDYGDCGHSVVVVRVVGGRGRRGGRG